MLEISWSYLMLNWFQKIVYSIPVPLPDPLKLVLVILIFLAILGLLYYLKVLPFLNKLKIKKKLYDLHTRSLFPSDIVEKAQFWYINQNCKSLVLSKDTAQAYEQSDLQDMSKTVSEIIEMPDNHQYSLILGEAGLGKTSFCINFYMNYLRNMKNKFNIELFPLYDTETTRKIRDIKKKSKTILLLDALDEDPQIHQNFSYRLKEIIERTEGFHKIIITCNPRLFQMKIVKHTDKIEYHSKEYNPTSLIKSVFYMLQILPFTDKQIISYIEKKYKNTDSVKFQRSQQIVKSLPKLFSKPIMLHYIDTLVQKDITVKYSYEIFKEFVTLFLEQEGKNIQGITRNTLKACYKVIAFALFNRKNEQGSDYISKSEIQALGKKYNIDIFTICCMHKGLLKNSNGFYSFVHLSIMEYLVAESILSGQFPNKSVQLSKQIFLFLYEMIEKESPFKKSVPPKTGLFRYLWSAGIDMKSLNLKNSNLAGTDFSDLNIVGLDLSGSDLHEAEFYLTTIKDSNFEKANLSNVTFRRSELQNVTMRKCTFSSTKFNQSTVIKSVFTHSVFTNSLIGLCKFTESEFSNTDMTRIHITDSLFHKSDMQYTDLQNCEISKSEF